MQRRGGRSTFTGMRDRKSLSQIKQPLERAEYDRLTEQGVFQEDERVELLRGMLIAKSPIGSLHVEVVKRLNKLFIQRVGDRADVLVQSSYAATHDSEPEPDLAIVPAANYSAALPSTAFLVIEVSESSLRIDRKVKSGIYADAKVPEYWIVNLKEKVVEIRTEPCDGGYEVERVARGGEEISPIAFPDLRIPVSTLVAP